jgi:NitT/TauT family transport system ATP-binding protein
MDCMAAEPVRAATLEGGAGSGPAFIQVQDVGLVYGEPGSPRAVEALRRIELGVGQEQFVSIIGPSGCGKSTLLKIVAGLLQPTSGTVLVNGQTPEQARQQRAISFVFQTPVLLPWRTVLDNVALLLEVQGIPRQERLSTARQYIELVGLSGFESHRPRELSGGMQQRVSIARALSFGPSILLMDEPFGALDAITRDRMGFELLDIWQKSQKTVLFVTHSVSEAVLLSDVVVVMTPRPGRVKAVYTIDLPRPRRLETRVTPPFIEYTRQLLQDLESDRDATVEAL